MMDLSRRGFFRLLGAAAVAPVLEPIAKRYFFSPIGGWKSDVIVNPGNQFLTVNMVTAEALSILKKEIVISSGLNRINILYGITPMAPQLVIAE